MFPGLPFKLSQIPQTPLLIAPRLTCGVVLSVGDARFLGADSWGSPIRRRPDVGRCVEPSMK